MSADNSAARLFASNSIALTAILHAIAKQPGIDVEKLTNDISEALLLHETNSEAKPEGVAKASADDYVLIRAMLKQALPSLPIR